MSRQTADGDALALRRQRGDLLPPDKQITDANGDIGAPYRAVDVLDRLLANSSIDEAEFKAGREFQDDFDKAQLNGQQAMDLSRPFVKTVYREAQLAGSTIDARRRISDMIKVMGGYGSPAAMVTWEVLGERRSIREYSDRTRLAGRRPVGEKQASGVLVAALGVLAVSYGFRREAR